MSPLTPYSVAVDDQTITIRADRTVFDTVALTKLLDYLSLESIRRHRQAILADDVDPEQTQLQQEVEAYKTMHPHLLTHHSGQWVAIYQGHLLDHDYNEDALMTRLAAQYPTRLILVRRVEGQPDQELYVPSYRLAA